MVGNTPIYTPGSTNIADWKKDPDWRRVFLLNMGIFQRTMLVYHTVLSITSIPLEDKNKNRVGDFNCFDRVYLVIVWKIML